MQGTALIAFHASWHGGGARDEALFWLAAICFLLPVASAVALN